MLDGSHFEGLITDFSYADAQRLFVPD